MKKALTVILILLVLCAAGAWFAYNSWKESPAYSLAKAGLALQENNSMMIEKYINIDSVLGDTVDTIVRESVKNYGGGENSDMMNIMIAGFASAMKPHIVSALKQNILEGIKKNSGNSSAEETAKSKIKSLKTLKKDDDLASVEVVLLLPEFEEELKLMLGMKKHSNYWRIEKIENLEENISKLFNGADTAMFLSSSNPEQDIAGEMTSTLKAIASSMQRAMLMRGRYPTDLSQLDILLTNIPSFKGSSFKTDYFEVEILNTANGSGKIVAKRIGPNTYTLTKYYDESNIICQDNGSGICGQLNFPAY